MSTIFFLDHENSRDFRVRKIASNAISRFIQKHDQKFNDDENEKSARDQNEKNDDNDARVEKKKSKRMTQRKFYSYIIQIRRFLHFSHRSTISISISFFFTYALSNVSFSAYLKRKKNCCENHFFINRVSHSSNREIFNDDELLFVL